MIFKASEVHNLKNGDTKTVSHFAWLPKQIGNKILWLHWYETLEAWTEKVRVIQVDNKNVEFVYGHWETISERLIAHVE